MEFKYFTSAYNLALCAYQEIEWNKDEYEKVDLIIAAIENNFPEELHRNIYENKQLIKEERIRIYFTDICDIYESFLMIVYDENETIPNQQVIKKAKDCFQFIVDQLCEISIKNNIDLSEIVEMNPYLAGKINISTYFTLLKSSLMKKKNDNITISVEEISLSERNLKKCFIDENAYQLFKYINSNFVGFKDMNKYSCIYRCMIKDKLIVQEIRPEMFKRFLMNFYDSVNLELVLYLERALSTKIKSHYNNLKTSYFAENQ